MKKYTNILFINFFWKFCESTSSQLISFIVSIVLARLLIPKDYGIVALVNVFIVIAEVFVTSGFGTSLIQKKNATKTDFSTIFYCNLIVATIIYFILVFCAPFIAKFYNNSSLTLVICIFSLRLPLSSFNSIQQAYIAKNMLFKKTFVSTFTATLLSGALGITMAYLNFGVWALIGQYLSNAIFVSIVLYIQIDWHPQLVFSFKSLHELFGFSWKMLAADLSGQIFFQLRSLLIGKFYTSSDLAFYNRGQTFPNLISTNIDGTISTVLFSAMANLSDDKEEVKGMMRKAMKISTFILFPSLFGLAAMSKQVVLILLTSKWLPAVPYMQCLCVAAAFGTFSNENLQALKAIGKSDVILKLEFVKKPVFLILLLVSLKYSVLALAYTMILYDVYAMLVNMGPNKKFLNYSRKEQILDTLPAFFTSVIMSFFVYCIGLLSLNSYLIFIMQIFSGLGIYILFAKLFNLKAYNYLVKRIKK